MVQRSGSNIANVEVNNNTYIYYLMNATTSSQHNNGQHSNNNVVINKNELVDVDSIDSGTCSSDNSSQKTSPVPPPLPAKKHHQLNGIKMTTKIVLNSSCDEQNFSDSDESESSLSSMGSSTTQNSDAKDTRYSVSYSLLPDSLLKDIRDHSMNTLNRKFDYKSRITINHATAAAAEVTDNNNMSNSSEMVAKKCGDGLELVRKNTKYDADKYYNFHINERDAMLELPPVLKNPDYDETFAGYKEVKSGCSTIRSAKGTIRGVKNRVRNGIATFLQMQQQHATKVSEFFILLYLEPLRLLRQTI